MSSKLALGFGHFRLKGDKIPKFAPNFLVEDRILEARLNYAVDTGYSGAKHIYPSASPLFNRASSLRWHPDTGILIDGHSAGAHGSIGTNGNSWVDPDTFSTDYKRRRRYNLTSLATDDMAFAVGSVSACWYYSGDGANFEQLDPDNDDPPNEGLPNYLYGYPAISLIDIPGTQIGRLFMHPIGTNHLYNATGEVAISQGTPVISGIYAPPEEMLHHMAVRIYFTKSGGTGTPVSPAVSGTAGSVSTGSNEFTEAGKFGSAVLDQYIVVRNASNSINNGAFKITSIAGAPDSVTVDASAINQPFVTETGGVGGSEMTWELRDGPIGEYFWQGRPYFTMHQWAAFPHRNYCSQMLMGSHAHEMLGMTDNFPSVTVVQHDRGAFFYAICNHPTQDGEYGLFRWRAMSPDHYDPVYKEGRITGAPADIYDWRDIVIDDRDYLIACWAGHTDDSKHLMVFDPHPSGDSSAPESKAVYGKQSNASTADGFTSAALAGLIADDSQAYAAATRIWIFSEDDGGGGDGGISYTDDYFTTIKRIHKLQTVTGTDTFNASGTSITRVSGSTNLTTVFAEGDWVTVQDDIRAYEITGVAADTLTTATTVNTLSGKTIQKGALTDAQARIYHQYEVTTNVKTGTYANHPPCDYDSQGNIYWIPDGQDRVCKWDPSAGVVSEISQAQLDVTLSSANMGSLVVSRVPDIAGSGSSIWNDNIWIGCFVDSSYLYQNENSGWVRIYGGAFDGTHTRYSHRLTNNFPTSVDTEQYGQDVATGWYTLVEPKTGQIHLIHAGDSSTKFLVVALHPHDGDTVTATLCTQVQSNDGYPKWGSNSYAAYDDLGMGLAASLGAGYQTRYEVPRVGAERSHAGGMMMAPTWVCRRWDGTQWLEGPLNQLDTNIDFNAALVPAGPYVENVPSEWVGFGTKRMHEDDQTLAFGMTIRFEDAGSPTAQENEFIIDETATFVCFVGAGKDNVAEAEWGVDVYGSPTAYILDEPVKAIQNIWTSDGGCDGGETTGGTVDDFCPFVRGPGEISEYAGGGYDPYWDSDGRNLGVPDTLQQFMIALRIKDEDLGSGALEKSDGEVLAGLSTFQSVSTAFPTTVSGMSLIVEGSSAGNNGQRIITSADGTDTISVSPAFAGTEASVKFKVRDIPAVGYAVLLYERNRSAIAAATSSTEYLLRSSEDYGQTWTTEKTIGDLDNTLNEDVDMDDTCWFNASEFGTTIVGATTNATVAQSFAVFFSLLDKIDADPHSTKKQYWKVVSNFITGSNAEADPAGVILFDENFNVLGRTSTHRIEDADDDLFNACLIGNPMLVPYEATVSGYATDDSDGDDFTPYFDAPGANFYEASGLNAQITAATSQLYDSGVTFTRQHVGMYARVHDATNTENDGFHPIVDWVDANTVELGSTGLVDESGIDWELTKFGEGDYLRIKDSTEILHMAAPLEDIYYLIADIPSATRIELSRDELPVTISGLTVSGVDFDINRVPSQSANAPEARDYVRYDGFDASADLNYSAKFGNIYYGEELEFVEIQNGNDASSFEWGDGTYAGTDNDGDGRVNGITVSGITLDSEVAAGDFILVENSGHGRRVYEIADIDDLGDHADFKLYYDEMLPSQSFTTWKILTRRTWLKSAMRRTVVVLNENE